MKRTTVLLLLIVAVFLALQIVLIINVRIAQYDETIFLDIARQIRDIGLPLRSVGATGKLYFTHTPLYIYMLGGLMPILGDNVLLLRLVTVAFAVGSIILAFHIGRQAHSETDGLVAAALLALNPFFVTRSFYILMEIPFCFFLLLSLYFLLLAEQKTNRAHYYWLLAGFSIALMVLLKEIGLAFWATVLLYTVFSGTSWRERATAVVLIGLPALVSFFGWLGYAYWLDAPRLQETLARWFSAWQEIQTIIDPRYGIDNQQWLYTVGALVIGWPTILLFLASLIGAIFSWRRHRPPRFIAILMLYIVLALSGSLIMSLKEPRHVIGLIPTTALAIALLVDWDRLWQWAWQRPLRQTAITLTLLIIAWAISPLQLAGQGAWMQPAAWLEPQYAQRAFDSDPFHEPLQAAGLYLQSASTPGTVLIVVRQGPVVGYYAQRPYIFMYTRTFAENMALLQEAEFVVYDADEFWSQTAQETQAIQQYIQKNFSVEMSFTSQSQEVIIYRRQ